jgi:membrane-associated protease RseP (regulator of RpoE activity)
VLIEPRRMRWTSIILFVLTVASCGWTGGWTLAGAVLAILVAHEMGHFLACRYHGVPSTWPFLLPAPVLNPFTGTLGAVMVIQGRFPNRRALFDIGIAGPLAGLAVCLAVLHFGASGFVFAPVASLDPGRLISVGSSILYDFFVPSSPAHVPAGTTPLMGPLQVAAWFGLLLTGLNLIPIGQFDGGHILYALLPRYARRLARLAWCVCLGLLYFSPAWLGWAILTYFLGHPHPPTFDDAQPLGRARQVLGVVALAVFVLTFMPNPVHITWPEFLSSLVALWHSLFG